MFLQPTYLADRWIRSGSSKIVTILMMPDLVNVLKSDYTYGVLSLVAEIGGYVGLFLGFSVLQVSGLIKAVLEKLWLLADRRNYQRRQQIV